MYHRNDKKIFKSGGGSYFRSNWLVALAAPI
jgi:hypothetical protein